MPHVFYFTRLDTIVILEEGIIFRFDPKLSAIAIVNEYAYGYYQILGIL